MWSPPVPPPPARPPSDPDGVRERDRERDGDAARPELGLPAGFAGRRLKATGGMRREEGEGESGSARRTGVGMRARESLASRLFFPRGGEERRGASGVGLSRSQPTRATCACVCLQGRRGQARPVFGLFLCVGVLLASLCLFFSLPPPLALSLHPPSHHSPLRRLVNQLVHVPPPLGRQRHVGPPRHAIARVQFRVHDGRG